MPEKHIDFKVDYSRLTVYSEYNTQEMLYPIVLSSPHSGKMFPEEFLAHTRLSEQELRSSEDCFVDELVMPASDAGIPLIAMNLPRTFVDVSRDKIELDDSMYFNHPSPQTGIGSRRCRVGLGVIHRAVAQTKNIYDGLISYDEVQERIKNVYDVYVGRVGLIQGYLTEKPSVASGRIQSLDVQATLRTAFTALTDHDYVAVTEENRVVGYLDSQRIVAYLSHHEEVS